MSRNEGDTQRAVDKLSSEELVHVSCDIAQPMMRRHAAIVRYVESAQMPGRSKGDVLLQCFDRSIDSNTRNLIVGALGSVHEAHVTSKLRELLAEGDVASSALMSLAKHKDRQAIVECSRRLRLGIQERHVAIVSLCILGDDEALEILKREYANEKSSEARLSLALAMAFSGCNIGEHDLVRQLQLAVKRANGNLLPIQDTPVLCGLCLLENRNALLVLESIVAEHSEWSPQLRLVQGQLKSKGIKGESLSEWKEGLLQWLKRRLG